MSSLDVCIVLFIFKCRFLTVFSFCFLKKNYETLKCTSTSPPSDFRSSRSKVGQDFQKFSSLNWKTTNYFIFWFAIHCCHWSRGSQWELFHFVYDIQIHVCIVLVHNNPIQDSIQFEMLEYLKTCCWRYREIFKSTMHDGSINIEYFLHSWHENTDEYRQKLNTE